MSRLWAIMVAFALISIGPAFGQTTWQVLATHSAIDALNSPDPKVVAHGIDALAALRAERELPRIIAAYRKFRGDAAVRTSMKQALGKLPLTAQIATALLDEAKQPDANPSQASSPEASEDPLYYPALAASGPKAAEALPSLLKTFEARATHHDSDPEVPQIAAIGLRTDEQVDQVLAVYTRPSGLFPDYSLDALRGMPAALRRRAALRFLPLTLEQGAGGPTGLAIQSVRALGVLEVGLPEVLTRLEQIMIGPDHYLKTEAAATFGAILAANPTLAPNVFERRIYPGGKDLVEVVAQLAGENASASTISGNTGFCGSAPMTGLAKLTQVSPEAAEVFKSFLHRRYPLTTALGRMSARYLAICALRSAQSNAADMILDLLPLPGYDTGLHPFPTDSSERYAESQEILVQFLLSRIIAELGPSLAPAFPRFLSGLDTFPKANDSRMLSWAIAHMSKLRSSAASRILPLLRRAPDHEVRAYLLAAYLNGGGDPNLILGMVQTILADEKHKRAHPNSPDWEASGNGLLTDAVLNRTDFRWNDTPSGQAIMTRIIQGKEPGQSLGYNSADFVPFGPLSLSQALLLLERAGSSELEDQFSWTMFLAPNSRTELRAVLDVRQSKELPSDMGSIRALLPVLAADLRTCSRGGGIQYDVAPAITLLYGRGARKWEFDDASMLVNVADALDGFAQTAKDPLALDERVAAEAASLREEAARTAALIRSRIAAEQQKLDAVQQKSAAERRGEEFQKQAEKQLRQKDQERQRLLAASLGLGALLVSGAVVLFSAAARRRLLIFAGRRWVFVSSDGGGTLEVTERNAVFRPSTGSQAVLVSIRADQWPPATDQLATLKLHFQPGWNIRVLANEAQFRRPWSHLVGSSWSEGETAVVAGQLCLIAPDGTPFPQAVRSITFASFSCAEADGCPPLTGVDEEIRSVERSFRRWGAVVLPAVTKAAAASVTEGLTGADIIHVAAHASGAGIHLSDRFLGATDIERLGRDRLRCRLLVLSACDAGRLDHEHSFVYALVRAGVNVLAARSPVLDQACVVFFEEFYKALLPARRAEGIDLGTAIRRAAQSCDGRFQKIDVVALQEQARQSWKQTVDSFTLYGDPSVHLKLTSPKRKGVGISS